MGTRAVGAAALAVAAVLSACDATGTSDAQASATVAVTPPSPSPSPSPSPTPSPTPPPPVQGEATVTVVDANRSDQLLVADQHATDEAAVDDFVGAVVFWLDVHLTALQLGEPGRLAGAAVLDGAPDDAVTALTTKLASPHRLVRRARYDVTVAVAGEPLWALARIRVVHEFGVPATAELVFLRGRNGPVVTAAAAGPRPA